jgi:hypothetical protein
MLPPEIPMGLDLHLACGHTEVWTHAWIGSDWDSPSCWRLRMNWP